MGDGEQRTKCNLSFNVLRIDHWKWMVRAIAVVGPFDTWSGVDYQTMRRRILDVKIECIEWSCSPCEGHGYFLGGWIDVRYYKHFGLISFWHILPLSN